MHLPYLNSITLAKYLWVSITLIQNKSSKFSSLLWHNLYLFQLE